MRILLCSALYREIKLIARSITGTTRLSRSPRKLVGEYLGHRICLVETGIGGRNGRKVLESSINGFAPDAVISLGYCGSITSQIGSCEVVRASSVSLFTEHGIAATVHLPDGSRIFSRLPTNPLIRAAAFLTLSAWMEKPVVVGLLSEASPPSVCDMETFHLARFAQQRNIPFLALRAVSDGHDQVIGFDPLRLCGTSGFYSPVRTAAFFMVRPNLLHRAIKLRRSTEIASVNLARAVNSLLRVPNLKVPAWRGTEPR